MYAALYHIRKATLRGLVLACMASGAILCLWCHRGAWNCCNTSTALGGARHATAGAMVGTILRGS